MGMVLGRSVKSKEEQEMALSKVKDIVSSYPVLVFSKTYCGYCKRVKNLLTQLGASFKVIELDKETKSAWHTQRVEMKRKNDYSCIETEIGQVMVVKFNLPLRNGLDKELCPMCLSEENRLVVVMLLWRSNSKVNSYLFLQTRKPLVITPHSSEECRHLNVCASLVCYISICMYV